MRHLNNSNGIDTNGHHTLELQQKELTLHDYLAVLFRGRWTIAATFVVVVLAVTYYTFTTDPVYEASTTIMIDEKQGMGETLFDVSGFSQQRTLINNQVEILKSRSLNQAVIARLQNSDRHDSLELLRDLGTEKTYLDVLNLLRESTTVSPIRDTDLITIRVRAPSPSEAVYLAETITQVYQEMDRNFSRGEISQVVQFLEEQLARKELDLKHSENNLKEFMQSEKIASLTEEATQIVEQGAEFESMYEAALIDYQVVKKRLDYLKGLLGKSKATLEAEMARVSSPLVIQLRQEMAEIERNIAVFLSQGVPESDPQVRREQEKLAAIKARLTEEIRALIVDGLPPGDPLAQAQDLVVQVLKAETELNALDARAEGLRRVVNNFNTELESLPDKHVQLARLERIRKVDENLYVMMREKYEESRIKQAGQIGKVRIIDRPLEPVEPISPKKVLNLLIGAMLGLGLGLGITFLREQLDRSLRRVEEVENLGLTVLSTIPQIDSNIVEEMIEISNGSSGEQNKNKLRLITHFKPKSPISEAYRTLRTNLQFSQSHEQLRSFLVTSSGPGEGKSTTIANLAIAMAQQGTRTILIDADLRKPVVHKTFEVDKSRGLTNVLVGKMSLDEAIQSSSIPNLDILSCGVIPPNPAELLGSKNMKRMINLLQARYDLCLFDTPPLIAVTDAAVLSKELDGVLLVVKAGVTQKDALFRGVELLSNVNARVLGALLNGVNRDNSYGSYYYYQQYYYDEEPGKKKRKRKSRKPSVMQKVHVVD